MLSTFVNLSSFEYFNLEAIFFKSILASNFGLFVKLPNLIEGLVHISTLKGFCTYVPNLLSLVSDGKIRYSLGQQVKVRVTGASKENSTIDFEIIGDTNDRDKK